MDSENGKVNRQKGKKMMKIRRRITKAYFYRARKQYAPLVQRLAFTIGIDNTHIEELKSRADEEILKCMICYDKSGSFMTFVYFRLFGIFRHLRDIENRAKRNQSLSMESVGGIAGPEHDADRGMIIQECLDCLDVDERDVITELFFKDKTMREVSMDRGVVASTICRIKTRAIEKMKQKCEIE